MFLKDIYEKHYKLLLIIPITLFLLAFFQLGTQYANTGDFINKGVSLKGGMTVSIDKSLDTEEVRSYLAEEFPEGDVSVRSISGESGGIIIEASDIDPESLVKTIDDKYELNKEEYSVEVMGSSLGESFFKETFTALIIAFICMGLVVFIYFRTFVPSISVILSAFSDIIVTVAIVNLFGIKLSTAGIAAFLMMIGYSVDTDILLSTRVLKRNMKVMDGVYSAMKTGLTMAITTLVAITIALIFSQSDVIRQIMIILLVGTFIDLINTWIQTSGILRLYLEKKNKNGQN